LKWRQSSPVGDYVEAANRRSRLSLEERNRLAAQPDLFPETTKVRALPSWFLPLLVVILVSTALIGSAFATEVKVSNGLLCDTADQVKTVVTADDQLAAYNEQNKDDEVPVCVLTTASYSVIRKVDTVINNDGVIDIYEVQLIGFSMDGGMTFIKAKQLTQFIPVLNGEVRGAQI
jgi:hypothetical protein